MVLKHEGVSVIARLVEWWRNRRRPEPGLNSEEDAKEFIEAIHAPEPPRVPAEPTRTYAEPLDPRTPIHDELWREFVARMRQNWKWNLNTQEVRTVFDELTAPDRWAAEAWRCDACRLGRHGDCAGCACPLHLVEVSR